MTQDESSYYIDVISLVGFVLVIICNIHVCMTSARICVRVKLKVNIQQVKARIS